jgi:hypothetical protein
MLCEIVVPQRGRCRLQVMMILPVGKSCNGNLSAVTWHHFDKENDCLKVS